MSMFGGLTKLASEGDEGGVRRMLDEGTPVDVIDNGRFNVTPLQVAARSGHLGVVQLLLERGADVNHVDNDGFSPVTYAAEARKWAVVKVLAEHGGDFGVSDATGRNGFDYLRRCRGRRIRAEIEAVLAQRSPRPAPESGSDQLLS
jgi:ankyrin repeat protein